MFLAGDAAHVHSPAGGQGMNVGLQDTANLGWKVAAAVAGRAAPGLLDSYQAERHPVGRQVLRSSGAIIKLAMVRTRPARLARNLMARTLLGFGPIGRRATGAISESWGSAIPRRAAATGSPGSGSPTSRSSGTDRAGSTSHSGRGSSCWCRGPISARPRGRVGSPPGSRPPRPRPPCWCVPMPTSPRPMTIPHPPRSRGR